MAGFIYYTDEQKQRANAVDLIWLLQTRGEKLIKSGREMRLDSDHSITVRGNEWYDHAVEKGGLAIDFVQYYYEKSFPEAMNMLLNGEDGQGGPPVKERKEPEKKPFALPQPHPNMHRVFAYLIKTRRIDREIVTYFAKQKMLYEDAKYHNAVFVGYNEDGIARHAHKRSTHTGSGSFKGNIESSLPRFSFHHAGTSDTVYVFEAPIDMMSFITMYQKNWKQHSYVSLCGVSHYALLQMLETRPQIRCVGFCLDRDEEGHKSSERLKNIIRDQGYSDFFRLEPANKDWNEDLVKMRGEVSECRQRMSCG